MLLNIFTQGAVDVRLIDSAVRRMGLEPCDHVGIDPWLVRAAPPTSLLHWRRTCEMDI